MAELDLDQLADEAAATVGDGIEDDAAGTEPGPLPVDNVAELRAAFALAVGILTPAFPWLPTVYTDPQLDALAGATAGVCAKYGWNMGDLFGRWGPEIHLLVVVLPLGAQTVAAHKAHRAALAKAADQAATHAEDTPPA